MERPVSLILNAFEQNRIKAEFVKKVKRPSFILYVFKKIGFGAVTDKREDKISLLLSSSLGYRPQVSYEGEYNAIFVYLKRYDNRTLEYPGRFKKTFSLPLHIGKREDGNPVVLNAAVLDSILINGSLEWGRKNLLGLIIRQFIDRKDMDLVLIDLDNSGAFDSYISPDIDVIRDEETFMTYCSRIIMSRVWGSILTDDEMEENEKERLFIFSGLSFSPENEERALSWVSVLINNGVKHGFHVVLSSDRTPPRVYKRRFLENIKCIISFKEDDESVSRALFKSGDATALFYPDEAIMSVRSYSRLMRIQCYRL